MKNYKNIIRVAFYSLIFASSSISLISCGSNKKDHVNISFSTKNNDANNKLIDAITQNDLINLLDVHKINLSSKTCSSTDETKLPSTITKPSDGDVKNVHYVFTEWNQDNDNGQITWKATLTKGDASKQLSGTIKGLVTNEQLIESIDESNLNLPNVDNTKLPSKITKPSDGDVKNVHYVFTEWNQDNDNGQITWKATLTKGVASKQLSGTIEGLETNEQLINSINIEDLIKIDNEKLPSEILKPDKGVANNGVHYKFTKWITDDDNGKIILTISLYRGETIISRKAIFTNFLTKNQHDTCLFLSNYYYNSIRGRLAEGGIEKGREKTFKNVWEFEEFWKHRSLTGCGDNSHSVVVPQWQKYSGIIEIPKFVKILQPFIFYNAKIELPFDMSSITQIKTDSFRGTILPIGFTISTNDNVIIDPKAFNKCILPENSHWEDKDGNRVSRDEQRVKGDHIVSD